jgi:hypothetical protein
MLEGTYQEKQDDDEQPRGWEQGNRGQDAAHSKPRDAWEQRYGRTLDQALRTPEHDQPDRQAEGKQPGYGVAELAYRPSTQDVREVGCHATDDGF